MEPANWIALGAIAITSLNLFLTYRERLSAMRSSVYGKQLDLIKEISPPFGVLCHELPHLFLPIEDERDERFVERARNRIDEAYVKLGELTLSMFTVLPTVVNDLFHDFKAASDDLFIYELNTPRDEWDADKIETLSDELSKASLNFIHATRNALGTGRLIEALVKTGGIDRHHGRIVVEREKDRSPRITERDPEGAAQEFLDRRDY